MMNSKELRAFPVKIATGGDTAAEKIEVTGAKAKAASTTVGGIIGAIMLAPLNGAISFITDVCALGADIVDSASGKGGD